MLDKIAHKILSLGFGKFIRNRARPAHPDKPHCFPTAFTSADGTRLHGWAYRPGHHTAGTLFLQHGLCCDSRTMEYLAFRLAEKFGAVAACFDSRHHGLSDDAVPTFGYWEGRDIQAALDDAERQHFPKPYIVIGDSLNGLAAQWVAAHDPRVDAAIMLESPGWPWDAVGKFLHGFKLGRFVISGHLINAAYGENVLTKGQLLGKPITPAHNPMVMYLIGDRDSYDWQCARRVYDHWYEGEPGGWNQDPDAHDGHRKWFHLVENAVHADGRPGTYSIHSWHRYHEVIEAFVATVLARRKS